jgi:hypothetical protein
MPRPTTIATHLLVLACLLAGQASRATEPLVFSWLGREVRVNLGPADLPTEAVRDAAGIQALGRFLDTRGGDLLRQMLSIREELRLCDWLYYQLIRKVADRLAPKASDYYRYTAVKYQLLRASGYDPILVIGAHRILLYIRSPEPVYNLGYRMVDDRQYVCLNQHDYGFQPGTGGPVVDVLRETGADSRDFHYAIDRMPAFPETAYQTIELHFEFARRRETIRIPVNPELKAIFANYPVTDYRNQFNIPVTRETAESLLGQLRQRVKDMDLRQGIGYLQQFTREAFPFARDTDVFGREKRLSPEETLIYANSDCEDRSALFFWLVREIYDRAMVVVAYEDHVTVAVDMGEPRGHAIQYNGKAYTICEPTPQRVNLPPGRIVHGIHDRPAAIGYAYEPAGRQ